MPFHAVGKGAVLPQRRPPSRSANKRGRPGEDWQRVVQAYQKSSPLPTPGRETDATPSPAFCNPRSCALSATRAFYTPRPPLKPNPLRNSSTSPPPRRAPSERQVSPAPSARSKSRSPVRPTPTPSISRAALADHPLFAHLAPVLDAEMASDSEEVLTESSSESSSSSSADDFTVVGKKRSRKAKPKTQAKAAKTEAPLATAPAPTPAPAAAASPASAVQSTSGSHRVLPRSQKPPPIFLHQKEKWTEVSSWCTTHHVQFTSGRLVKDGIKIIVPTSGDFRTLTEMLQARHLQYHTYALPEERTLRVVLKGLPVSLSTKEIEEDLTAQGIAVTKVHRMHRAKGLTPYEMVLAVIPRSADTKAIFKVKTVCHLSAPNAICIGRSPQNRRIKLNTQHQDKRGPRGQCHN
ncbi:flocculation protein FLO11-like [Trichoplusia ni]|uniref:Flocculation protein FLO11-like n=1 Tax=Trichoplusia ni TaxID=7111 RepID=A0A7E5WY77_TRINI|nr:flocculation protein FLO11-like [Trichoplusia ni]